MADLEQLLRDTTAELNATCADILKIPPEASSEIRSAFAHKYWRLTGERARLQAEVNGLLDCPDHGHRLQDCCGFGVCPCVGCPRRNEPVETPKPCRICRGTNGNHKMDCLARGAEAKP